MEKVVVKPTGVSNTTTVEDIIRTIRNAGRIPVQRGSRYEVFQVY